MRLQDITVHIEDHSREVMEAFQNAVERGLMAIGEKADTYAKDNITAQGAVDTGRLRNSITYAMEGHDGQTLKYTKEMQEAGMEAIRQNVPVFETDTVYIGTAVFYGPYIECGTGRYASTGGGTPKPSWTYKDEFGRWHIAFPQKPRPFLKPAVADHAGEFREILVNSLKNA